MRLAWNDCKTANNGVAHYRLYRMDTDYPDAVQLIGDRLASNEHVDWDYDGTRSYAYAVVPAFVDSAGVEIQGVSLDFAEVTHMRPDKSRFQKANHGVGHLRRMI